MTNLTTVAFDIETTGFETLDQFTVIGFDSTVASRVFLNTDGTTTPANLEDHLNTKLNSPVQLTVHNCEQELLNEMSAFVTSTLTQRNAKLVAYNGERWSGGFDLPFLRTRLCTHATNWPFGSLPYVDVMDVFEKRFNTTENTLCGVYEGLVGCGLNDLDPFTDSATAVTTWQKEDSNNS